MVPDEWVHYDRFHFHMEFSQISFSVSNKFGYGLMDAESLVKAALVWKTVPPQLSYTYNDKRNEPK